MSDHPGPQWRPALNKGETALPANLYTVIPEIVNIYKRSMGNRPSVIEIAISDELGETGRNCLEVVDHLLSTCPGRRSCTCMLRSMRRFPSQRARDAGCSM